MSIHPDADAAPEVEADPKAAGFAESNTILYYY